MQWVETVEVVVGEVVVGMGWGGQWVEVVEVVVGEVVVGGVGWAVGGGCGGGCGGGGGGGSGWGWGGGSERVGGRRESVHFER